ncbi:MAG: AbrB/MazE/SpoVT family DNA-binding domain-containing protein [Candidatus Dadabacteria bacterium]|nr:AbrB/MazE/SpoVT family DNA-binding domain-containing protein [Candidatus Dadabacteria bacterium]
MITSIKVMRMGDTVGVILPEKVVAKLRVVAGDKLNVTETPAGVSLSRYDKRQEKVMEIADRIMQKDREVLKKLAES